MSEHSDRLAVVVVPPTRDLGDGFLVRRALPTTAQRMVGPFVFLDQMGPHRFAPGSGLDVRPHPHIGLATLTYLFEGEIMHRDSLGTVMAIRPGAVNWMTAGRGIVHSERTAPEPRADGSTLFGLQCWVALPQSHEETDPAFVHVTAAELPVVTRDGVTVRIVAGSFFGATSPVPVLSPLFFVDVHLQAGATLVVPADYAQQAIYIVEGALDLEDDGVFDAGQLLVMREGQSLRLNAQGATRVVLLGGEALDGPRALSWNFVSSSLARLEQARIDWREQRFPKVPDETEWIPQPEAAGAPVLYP
jgi:redox-sensitive bicupin YhaK (pirin superfamily)